MRIKTITCHDVYNCGASLQAYALMTYLENLGHEVEIIDYKPPYLSKQYKLSVVSNPRFDRPIVKQLYLLAKLPGRIKDLMSKKKKIFDEFKINYLHVTHERYTSNEELKKNIPDADVYFAGSDQIWNSYFENGKDPAFYLDFASDDSIKASYAASFATDSIDADLKDVVRQRLQKLDFIGVREVSGLRILDELQINGQNVIDPVFLLEREYWDEFSKEYSYNDNYIFIYDFDQNEKVKDIAIKLAKSKNLKIYSYFKNEYCDRSFEDAGPIEFVALVKNASIVFSNSFHATAFSLIFNKEFWVINRLENINTRMRDLTVLAGIPDRLINNDNFDVKMNINYDTVNERINELIKNSKEFIGIVLSSGVK